MLWVEIDSVSMSDRKHHFEGCQVSKVREVQGFFLDKGGCHLGLPYVSYLDVSYITEWLNFKDFLGGMEIHR